MIPTGSTWRLMQHYRKWYRAVWVKKNKYGQKFLLGRRQDGQSVVLATLNKGNVPAVIQMPDTPSDYAYFSSRTKTTRRSNSEEES